MRISDWSSDVCSSDLAGEHVGDIMHNREWPLAFHVLVVMRGIGRQHHPAPLRIHTYRLQAFCVAAYLQQADSRRKLCITVVEYHSIFVNIANQRHNIVKRVSMPHGFEAHAAPCSVFAKSEEPQSGKECVKSV